MTSVKVESTFCEKYLSFNDLQFGSFKIQVLFRDWKHDDGQGIFLNQILKIHGTLKVNFTYLN